MNKKFRWALQTAINLGIYENMSEEEFGMLLIGAIVHGYIDKETFLKTINVIFMNWDEILERKTEYTTDT